MATARPEIDWLQTRRTFTVQYGTQPAADIEPAAALYFWQEKGAHFSPVAQEHVLSILAERRRYGNGGNK